MYVEYTLGPQALYGGWRGWHSLAIGVFFLRQPAQPTATACFMPGPGPCFHPLLHAFPSSSYCSLRNHTLQKQCYLHGFSLITNLVNECLNGYWKFGKPSEYPRGDARVFVSENASGSSVSLSPHSKLQWEVFHTLWSHGKNLEMF